MGRVIAEFGSLEEVAPVLGIDAELGRGAAAPAPPQYPVLEVDRARAYVEAVHRSQWLPAAGLPVRALRGAAAAAHRRHRLPQGDPANWAIAVGISAVLVMVALGTVLMTSGTPG